MLDYQPAPRRQNMPARQVSRIEAPKRINVKPDVSVLVGEQRPAPHNLEAEQALLGAILVDNDAMARVSGFLEATHFFDPLHARIYETLTALILAGKTATPITVKTFYENAAPIDAHTSVPQYLGRLAANATTIINAADYARTIFDLAARRSLIVIGEAMIDTAYDSPIELDVQEQLGITGERLDKIRTSAELVYAPQTSILECSNEAKVDTSSPYLIKGIIPSRSVSALYGASGSGKTFYALDLAFHICLGLPWRGRRVRQAPILYIALEGEAGFGKRVEVAKKNYGTPGKYYFARLLAPIGLGTSEANRTSEELIIRAAQLQKQKTGQPVGLIVIDTLARAMAGDNENEAAAMSTFLARVERIRSKTGAAVLLIHHPGKDQSLGLRGSSALFAALDAVVRIDREKQAPERTVTLEKSKDGIEGPIENFTLSTEVVGVDDDGDEISSCVVSPAEGACSARRRQVSPSAAKALTELEHLLLSGNGEQSRGHPRIPDGVMLIKLSAWREACCDKGLSGTGKQEAEKKAFQRALKDLEEASRIGYFGEFVWLTKGT